jgi:large subunit ribosomal protein L24
MKKFTDTQQKSYASRKKRHSRVSLQAVAKMKLKKGDHIIVISGKDKGKTGTIMRVVPQENRVLIDGVGMVKRHIKKASKGQSGRIIERPASVHASNVMLADPDTKKPTRVGRRIEDGKIVRYAKKSGTALK